MRPETHANSQKNKKVSVSAAIGSHVRKTEKDTRQKKMKNIGGYQTPQEVHVDGEMWNVGKQSKFVQTDNHEIVAKEDL